jgi:hypothetical protein
MVDRAEEPAWRRERAITRILASVVGVFFVIAGPLALIIYPDTRVEWTASAWKMCGFGAACIFCAAIGLPFVLVGITGQAPLWLRRCAQKKT